MSHLTPFNPALLTPEYWNGIDIHNPEHFPSQAAPAPHVTMARERAASRVLIQVLRGVDNNLFGERIVLDDEFEPDEWSDHTILAIESEVLLLRHQAGHEATLPHEALVPAKDAKPIIKPFAEYWRQSQSATGAYVDFGEEEAFLATGHDLFHYQHRVRWGVVTEAKDGTPVITTWDLKEATAKSLGRVGIKKTPGFIDRTLPLPLQIGTTQPKPAVELGGLQVSRSMTRVKEVHVVRSHEIRQRYPRLPKGGKRVRVTTLRDALNARLNLGLSI